jgi:hypothetical protein
LDLRMRKYLMKLCKGIAEIATCSSNKRQT